MSPLLNLVGFQAGWLACVLGAAHGLPWVGPVVVATLFAVHLAVRPNPLAEVRLGGAAAMLGLAADLLLVSSGAIDFPAHARQGWPLPLWMPALWLNFAMTLGSSLGWLRGRYAAAASLGAVGGPVSYYAGARLGAITVAPGGLWAIALEWLLATPLLVLISDSWRGAPCAERV